MTTVKLSDITPDERNANAHTERGTYMLRRSLERFGFLEPGVLDANNRIIGGNNRTEAAADVLDASEAVVIDIDGSQPVFVRRSDLDLTTPEGREAAIALNRTAQVGIEFDPDVLNAVLADGVDLGDWFKTDELIGLGLDVGQPQAGDAEPQIDRADELREKWGVEVGQLWRLPSRTPGREHRLICGDCTDAAVVGRVMGGERAALVITSPPYNRGTTTGHGFHAGGMSQQLTKGYADYDDSRTVEDYRAWQGGLLRQWWDNVLTDDGAIFYNHRPRVQSGIYETPLDWNPDLPVRQIIIWHSGAGINFAPTHYRVIHEWIVVYAKPKFRLTSRSASTIGDVWTFGPQLVEGHPAPFPVELPMRAMSTTGVEVIYEPFLGSGTTLIAAENLGRQCRAVELSPGYVAVALERYCDAFGITPELIA